MVFYRHLEAEDPGCWKIELPGKTTTWLTSISVSGVNKDKPIKRVSGVSCDEEWEVRDLSPEKKPSQLINSSLFVTIECFPECLWRRRRCAAPIAVLRRPGGKVGLPPTSGHGPLGFHKRQR